MRHLLVLLLLTACEPPCDGKLVSISGGHTSDDNGETVTTDPCYEVDGNDYDYSDCCPDGYVFLAMESSSSVLCQQECGLGSEASVEQASKVAFFAHGMADAFFTVVEDLATAP